MFLDWIFYTFFICCSLYLVVMVFYYKTLLKKERAMRDFVKNNLDDTEIIIRKLQVQLQRSLGNIDILTDELNKIKREADFRNEAGFKDLRKLNTKLKKAGRDIV